MKYTIAIILAFVLLSCSEKKESINLPQSPESEADIKKSIVGKHFTTSRIALASPFELEEKPSYDWMEEMKDTTLFFKTYLQERKKFSLSFQNDSVAIIFDDNKTTNGIYKIDSEKKEDEKDGFKLRFSYPDSSMSFPGATEPMIMTSTYYIAGVNGKELFLELPREYNNRKVLALLKVKE